MIKRILRAFGFGVEKGLVRNLTVTKEASEGLRDKIEIEMVAFGKKAHHVILRAEAFTEKTRGMKNDMPLPEIIAAEKQDIENHMAELVESATANIGCMIMDHLAINIALKEVKKMEQEEK